MTQTALCLIATLSTNVLACDKPSCEFQTEVLACNEPGCEFQTDVLACNNPGCEPPIG